MRRTATRPGELRRARSPRTGRSAIGGAIALILAVPIGAADWPQFRGPNRDGRSADTGLLAEWPQGGPPLAWKASGIGGGYSSVSVVGGRIFTMGDLADGQYVLALSEADGSPLWKTRVGSVHEDGYGGPRATPTFSGGRLYTMTTAGDVVCLDAATGEERWRRSLPSDFGGYLMKAMGSYDWRFSESPLVDGKRVVVTPGHVEAMMVALDADAGAEIWRTAGRRIGPIGADGAAYSSVVVAEVDGTRQYVQLVGRGLIGVEAETGKLLWSYNRVASDIANIATPIVAGDLVFASTGYGTGAALVRIRHDGEEWQAEETYFLEGSTFQNHHGGLILDQGTIYSGTGHNRGYPIAVDHLSGKVLWGPESNEGTGSAAVTYADGRLYLRYENGRMLLIDASRDGYAERGTFMIPPPIQRSWSPPVVANGRLYLREQDNLFSYDVRRTVEGKAEPTASASTK